MIKQDFKEQDPINYIDLILKGGGHVPTEDELEAGSLDPDRPEIEDLFARVADLESCNISLKTL